MLVLSTVLGAASGLGGFILSAITDLLTGAVIMITSSILLVTAAGVMQVSRRHDRGDLSRRSSLTRHIGTSRK